MYWTSFFALLAVPACQALPSIEQRASMSDVTLYAFGNNISGLPVVYDSTSTALYAAQTNTTLSSANTITWDIPSITTASTVATVGTLGNGTEVGGIYIDTSGDVFDEVLCLSNATLGFAVYGKQLVYYDGSSLQSEFWAKTVYQTDGTTVYALHWNSDNQFRDGSVPVVLKALSS